MVICGSYMHAFSVSKDMKNKYGGAFMSDIDYRRIEN